MLRHGALVQRLGTISDETSVRVAGMYDASPYPRWTSVLTHREGAYLKQLRSVFKPEELVFLRRPFEVLIAGCGTGRQAVSAAFDYGTNANVIALDIAIASLGYASRMASRMGAGSIRFLQGDIQQIETYEPSFVGRFPVIECVGVLHHMARPFDGWRALRECLAPGGLMLIGLYSASARRNLAVLQADPAFPGRGCDAQTLRRYRQHVRALPKGVPGSGVQARARFLLFERLSRFLSACERALLHLAGNPAVSRRAQPPIPRLLRPAVPIAGRPCARRPVARNARAVGTLRG